ncbi:MAG: hypothetical protein M3R08_07445, partial [Bacteroidota bacterium]|nr:hypothetical protein [Bacteroidota bacterium]
MISIIWGGSAAKAQDLQRQYYQLSNGGKVHSVLVDTAHDLLYVGGQFQSWEPVAAHGIIADLVTGKADQRSLRPDNDVYTSIPDGSGGWYIGGGFSHIASEPRSRIARLNSDGSLHPMQLGTINGAVKTMTIHGSTLYVAGTFNSVNGIPRLRACAFDLTTGELQSWDPAPDNEIRTIVVHENIVYVGGIFQNVGGQPRQRIAALDMANGNATAWNPIADGAVNELYPSGDSLFVGGEFYSIGGSVVRILAALDVNTGLPSSWQPYIQAGAIYSMVTHGNQLFIGGSFGAVDMQTRSNIAAFNLSTGALDPWSPTWDLETGIVPSAVNGLAVTSEAVYSVGVYAEPNSLQPFRAFDRINGQAIPEWAPSISSTLHTITISLDQVYIGGEFNELDEVILRSGIASVHLSTGEFTSWAPTNYSSVSKLLLKDSVLYITGSFTGAPGSYIRALNINTLQPVIGFNAQSNGAINNIVATEDRLYVVGSFTMIGGIPRTH